MNQMAITFFEEQCYSIFVSMQKADLLESIIFRSGFIQIVAKYQRIWRCLMLQKGLQQLPKGKYIPNIYKYI